MARSEDSNMANQERGDLYSRITTDIIAAIEAGAAEFKMPWHHDGTSTSRPINVASNKAYRGINTLALWASANRGGYASAVWGTYRQWNAKGAQVRRGERSTTVVFWKIDDRAGPRQGGEEADRDAGHRVLARAYTVFNSLQVDGYNPPELPILGTGHQIDEAEQFCTNL
jgi:antirestriction protein ArdC